MTGPPKRPSRRRASPLLNDPGPKRQSKSYMLKLWNDAGDDATDPSDWRASLVDVHTKEARHFASIEELVARLGELHRGTGPTTNDADEEDPSPDPSGR